MRSPVVVRADDVVRVMSCRYLASIASARGVPTGAGRAGCSVPTVDRLEASAPLRTWCLLN